MNASCLQKNGSDVDGQLLDEIFEEDTVEEATKELNLDDDSNSNFDQSQGHHPTDPSAFGEARSGIYCGNTNFTTKEGTQPIAQQYLLEQGLSQSREYVADESQLMTQTY